MGCRVAIVGGGPGGLMTAYQLQQRCQAPFSATIYEATARLGGKVLTLEFGNGVGYEAGAAELYDYSATGEDPLRELVERLGLRTKAMSGSSVVMDGKLLADLAAAGRVHGEATGRALAEFYRRARQWMSPKEFYESDWQESNADPKAQTTFEEELALIPDAAARRYLRTLVHSDLATEPHRTSASYGLQNYLMNDPAYMTLYAIEGGVGRLPLELAARVNATLRLNEPATRVERIDDDRLRVISQAVGEKQQHSEDYDFVVVALPNDALPSIEFAGERLAEAMHRHHIHYDYPAHYLRVSVLFREAFWQDHLTDSYLMLDAFGGCCLYNESSRSKCGTFGVLGWLLGGDAAVKASNSTDDELIQMALDSLPEFLQHGHQGRGRETFRELVIEGRVHRWIGTVNGLPGGRVVADMQTRHMPDPAQPNLIVVGDYLFDSTLNGVLDSADFAAELLAEKIEARTPVAPAVALDSMAL